VNRVEFDRLAEAFASFRGAFASLFGRPEAADHSEQYLRGLLVQQTDWRNAENVSEAVGGPQVLQCFLSAAPRLYGRFPPVEMRRSARKTEWRR
jgi:hypothetical protein